MKVFLQKSTTVPKIPKMGPFRLENVFWKLEHGKTDRDALLKLELKKNSRIGPKTTKWDLSTRQASQTKIFSPRQASNRRPSAWEAPMLTTGGVIKPIRIHSMILRKS